MSSGAKNSKSQVISRGTLCIDDIKSLDWFYKIIEQEGENGFLFSLDTLNGGMFLFPLDWSRNKFLKIGIELPQLNEP